MAIGLQRNREPLSPAEGTPVPEFNIFTTEGTPLPITSLWKEKPTLLIFGSATCEYLAVSHPKLTALHQQFQDQIQFAMIYIREAHAADSGFPQPKVFAEVPDLPAPKNFSERSYYAEQYELIKNLPFPVYVDNINDTAASIFSAWPIRYYVIATGGTVVYKGRIGPWGARAMEKDSYDPVAMNPWVNATGRDESVEAFLKGYLKE